MAVEMNNQVMVPWDDELVAITKRYEQALHELMEAKLEMLGNQLTPECWKWMCCFITDLADLNPIRFEAGDDETRPHFMEGYRTRVFFNQPHGGEYYKFQE